MGETESLRGVEQLLRAEGSKASRQYEEMGGFPGSGYASRLGLTMLKGAAALASALERLEAAERLADAGVRLWKGEATTEDNILLNSNAVLREASYDPEEVAAKMREAAMQGTYDRGYQDGVLAERARISAGLATLAREEMQR